MRIDALKRCLLICREANVTAFIWGHKGIGKSSSVKQLTSENRMGFIDMRMSQIEASDIRGLPDKREGRTEFLPPADMPRGGMTWEELGKLLGYPADQHEQRVAELRVTGTAYIDPADTEAVRKQQEALKEATRLEELFTKSQMMLNEGILFLDEANRAQDDVLQAAFQLVLDRRVGQYVLPAGWTVVAAGNFTEGYMTNGFTDPAFLDRFCHLILSADDTTLPEWVDFIVNKHGEVGSDIVEFASQNLKFLHGDPPKSDLGFSIQPSPRSWESVVRVRKAFKKADYGQDALQAVVRGLVGEDMAQSYLNYSCPVKPLDLIRDGIDAHREKLDRLERNQLQGLVWGLAGMLKKKVEEEKYGDLAIEFGRYLVKHAKDKDVGVAYIATMLGVGTATNSSQQQLRQSVMVNPHVAEMIKRHIGTGAKKNFLTRMLQDPELQPLIHKVSWNGSM